MNIRLSEKQIRFRISQDELRILLEQGILKLDVTLPESRQSWVVQTDQKRDLLNLEQNGEKYLLSVNFNDLVEFSQQLPSREGLEKVIIINGQHLMLVLEVDIHKSKGDRIKNV